MKQKAEQVEKARIREIEHEEKMKCDEAVRTERAAVRAENASLRESEDKKRKGS